MAVHHCMFFLLSIVAFSATSVMGGRGIDANGAVTLRFGVLDNKGNQTRSYLQWSPTFKNYIEYHLLRIGHPSVNVTVVALPFDALTAATAAGDLDLVYSNTGHSASLAQEYSRHSILSVENMRLGQAQTLFGGIIMTQNNSAVLTPSDCANFPLELGAVSLKSFGGFVTQMKELSDRGVDLSKLDRSKITFYDNHEDVIRNVNNGNLKCGFVRTDKLEGTMKKEPHNTNNIRVVGKKVGIKYDFFPFLISTELYPEWLVTASNDLDRALEEKFVAILLSIRATTPCALAGQYSRWFPPPSLATVYDALWSTNSLRKPVTPEEKSQLGLILGLTFGLLAIIAAGSGGFLYSRSAAVKNRLAPKEAPLCIMFTDVETSTELWQMYPEAMSTAMEIHHQVIRQQIAEADAYEVKTIGDSFMIAMKNPIDAMMLSLGIQRGLYKAEWPVQFKYPDLSHIFNGLKVRIALHYCQDIEPKFEPLHSYYDYYGNDVNISARLEGKTPAGLIGIDHITYNKLRDDPDFDLVGNDMRVELKDKELNLKGVEEVISLYVVTPIELSTRIEACGITVHGGGSQTASNMQSETASVSSSCAGERRADVLNVLTVAFCGPNSARADPKLIEMSAVVWSLTGEMSTQRKLRTIASRIAKKLTDEEGPISNPHRRRSSAVLHPGGPLGDSITNEHETLPGNVPTE